MDLHMDIKLDSLTRIPTIGEMIKVTSAKIPNINPTTSPLAPFSKALNKNTKLMMVITQTNVHYTNCPSCTQWQ